MNTWRRPSWLASQMLPFLIVLGVATVSCGFFWWGHQLWLKNYRRHFPALDNIKSARLLIAKSYLFAELALSGDRTVSVDDVLILSRQAEQNIDDCRLGYSSISGLPGEPISDPEAQVALEDFKRLSRSFSLRLKAVLAAPPADKTGESLTLRPVFFELTRLAEAAELRLNAVFQEQLVWQHRVHTATLAAWFLFLLLLSGILHLSTRARIRALDELRRSEQNLRITLDSIGDAVIATDADGRVVEMNPVAEHLTGWPRGEAYGRSLPEVFPILNAQTRLTVENPVTKVLREGRVVGLANHTVLLGRDGVERQIADSGAPIRDAAARIVGVVLVFRDVTDQYRLEAQLRQNQKLEALGRLAGGVAHDFNNVLASMLGSAQLLRRKLPEKPDLSRYVEIIERAAERASHLTKQLLSFSRKGKFQNIEVDLNVVVHNVQEVLEHVLDKRIELRLRLNNRPLCTQGDPSQLENAVLNLALNARDAMPQGGMLEFSTRLIALDESFSTHRLLSAPPGRYVEVAISDTGMGIPPQELGQIFEPFFTTKESGQGTGLGLPAVYGAVKEHGGAIEVFSQPGEGTTFRLYLPWRESTGAVLPLRSLRLPRGTGRVLIIEDETFLQELMAEMLTNLGYQPQIVGDGETALKLCGQPGEEFDLALLDVMMPGMGGEETLHALRQLRPKLPIVIVSGCSQPGVTQKLLEGGAIGFLRKPFSMPDLADMVAGVLAPSRSEE